MAEPGTGAPPRRNIDVDLAAIIYTSGSTGEPKGVMLTHRNMLTAATSISTYLENVEDDVILCVLPLAFDYGLYQMIMSVRMGARLVLERSFAFIAAVLEKVVAEKVTGFPGVPTVFATLAGLKSLGSYDFSNIRYVTNTAAALPVKHITMLKELFPKAKIFSMYGLTECKRCTYLPPADLERKPTSVGIAIPNTELWLVDENDQKVGPGVVGQLVIRGATVMKGYWEKPESTAKRLRPGPLPGEQVLYTGDFCMLDEEGYLTFIGRMDDIIKSRGEKVAPKEVESALVSIEGVKEAAVIGVPDELWGHAVKAFRRPGSRRDDGAEVHRARVSEAARELHGAEVRGGHRGAPEDDDGQDQEDGSPMSTVRFLGIEIETAEGVLVPRAETEILGNAAIELLGAGTNVIDMCCGAGNLACAIASARPGARVWASDLTDPCVALARRNVETPRPRRARFRCIKVISSPP